MHVQHRDLAMVERSANRGHRGDGQLHHDSSLGHAGRLARPYADLRLYAAAGRAQIGLDVEQLAALCLRHGAARGGR